MKKSVGFIFSILILFSLVSFGSAYWSRWVDNNDINWCGGGSGGTSGNCGEVSGSGSGNGYGCDGYTKKGCDDDVSGTYKTCPLEYSSSYCGYTAPTCTPLTCDDYEKLGQCGQSLLNGCPGGTNITDCFSNCSLGQFCEDNLDCQSGICDNGVCINAKINKTYWANLEGNEIASANSGDTVYMIFGGSNLEGKEINFSVQKEGSLFWGLINWWNDLTKINGDAFESISLDDGTYRFTASISGTDVQNTSEDLTVSEDIQNDQPEAKITFPQEYSNPEEFFNTSTNCPINFQQRSTDEDDLLNVTWSFEDGTSQNFANYSLFRNATSADFSKSYAIGGNYTYATLRVNEMTRNQDDEDQVRIYVFKKGINLVPVISSPSVNSVQRYQVFFDASQSYVVNCSETIEDYDFEVCNNLQCKYLLAPEEQTVSTGELRIRWTIKDGEGAIVANLTSMEGMVWNSTNYNAIGGVVFLYRFEEIGERRAVLELSYE